MQIIIKYFPHLSIPNSRMYINFMIKASQHNNKTPLFKFSPSDDIVAVASGSVVTIYAADGTKIDQFDTGELVIDLSWSADGSQLVTLSLNSHLAFMWKPKQRVTTKLTIEVEEPLCIDQSKQSKMLAIGSSFGHLFLYDSFTSVRMTISSKHTKRIISCIFSHQCDYISTLSAEVLMVSNLKGETLAYLKSKSFKGSFVNRMIACQIKGPDGPYDAITVPIVVDTSLQKNQKAEDKADNGLYLFIINIDAKQIVTQNSSGQPVDLHSNIKTCVHGSAFLKVPILNDNETILDIQYVQGQGQNFSPSICLLMSQGNILTVSLDHSRQEMAISTQESKFKYSTVVNRRENQFLNNGYSSYITLLSEINSIFQVSELSQGNAAVQPKLLQSLCPSTSYSILSSVFGTSGLLVPFDKSINLYDCFAIQQSEQTYIDFTGGKNSLGAISSYPTNIAQAASGNIAFLAFSNGSSMIILTKNVSQCLISNQEDIQLINSSLQEIQPPISQNTGVTVVNLTSPKTVLISKIQPAKFTVPLIQYYENEVTLTIEVQKLCVSQSAIAVSNSNTIQWSRLQTDKENNICLSWQSAQQMNIAQLEVFQSNDIQLVAAKTLDGQVAIHAGGGLQTILNTNGRTQIICCSSPFIYCLSEKALLQVFCIETEDDDIKVDMISQMQMSQQFCGTAAQQSNDCPGVNRLELLPGGIGCLLYKFAAKCSPQIFLAAEEILLDNLFTQEVSICYVLFDLALTNLFVCYANTQPAEKDVIYADEVITAALQFTIADKDGAGVLFSKQNINKKDISQLPLLISNCVAYQLNGKVFAEYTPIPGISNIAGSISQLKQLPPIYSVVTNNFIKEPNPILPIESSPINAIQTENDNVQVQLTNKHPVYKKIPLPSQQLAFMKGTVELCNLGFTQLAFMFAVRVQNVNLLKYVADASLRFTDFQTAKLAYNELSIKKIDLPDFNYKEYSDIFQSENSVEYLQDVQKCTFYKNFSTFNQAHNNDPAAFSLFINKICLEENDINTAMAYSLLLNCPDSNQDQTLDKAEGLLLKSNKPGLALSFRVDSLDWNTAGVLARKISSPYVRAEILIQQAGEQESKLQYQEAIDTCVNLLKQDQQKLDIQQLPSTIQPMFIGVVGRSYCQLGKVQETREFVMPQKQNKKYIQKPKDPLNILQRTRLCYECAEFMNLQKRFPDAALFYEAAASLAQQFFGKLSKEINSINTGETSLYDIVYGDAGTQMLLFQLLPQLKHKASISYLQIAGKQEENKYDIQLLRQLDNQLNNLQNQQQKQIKNSLPQKLQDIVTASDIAELEYSNILSKSANCYIKGRNYDQAESLIEYVTDKNTIADLARVFMRDDPEKALKLFKKAGKSIEIVECLLSLKKVQEAESAVKEVKNNLDKLLQNKHQGNETYILDLENEQKQSALLLAQFFRKANAPKKAIYYYIISENYNDAFELAIQTKNEEMLIRYVNNKAPQDFLRKTAKYFAAPDAESSEKKPRNMAAAAKFLELSGSVENAIKLLLNFGDGQGDIDKAIDLLRQGRGMVDYVLKYLQGGADGVKKNPIYIFKLYLALDRFNEASKTAFLLADREIEAGRYARAKQLLLTCMNKLKNANQNKVPQKFRQKLVLLHAVDTGRMFSQMKLHYQAGLCLYRASRVASVFQDQCSSIILSACVECWRSGELLKKQAYECACILLKDYEDEIPEKYKKAVDQVVRKYRKQTDLKPVIINCCQCGAETIQGNLECNECQAILPLDVSNGGQMSLSDFCECPYCNWSCSRLGLYEVYGAEQIKSFETKCLMCQQVFDLNQVLLVDAGNYALITQGGMNWEEYDHRPLIVFEDSSLARKRYEEWVKMWYSEDVE